MGEWRIWQFDRSYFIKSAESDKVQTVNHFIYSEVVALDRYNMVTG